MPLPSKPGQLDARFVAAGLEVGAAQDLREDGCGLHGSHRVDARDAVGSLELGQGTRVDVAEKPFSVRVKLRRGFEPDAAAVEAGDEHPLGGLSLRQPAAAGPRPSEHFREPASRSARDGASRTTIIRWPIGACGRSPKALCQAETRSGRESPGAARPATRRRGPRPEGP